MTRKESVENTWKEAIEYCRKTLGEEDYEIISGFKTPVQLIEAIHGLEMRYSEGRVPRVLKGIKPQLTRLQAFTGILMMGLGPPNLSMTYLWGSVNLLIEVNSTIGLSYASTESYVA